MNIFVEHSYLHITAAQWCYRQSVWWDVAKLSNFDNIFWKEKKLDCSAFVLICIFVYVQIQSLPMTLCCITWPFWANGITPRASLLMFISYIYIIAYIACVQCRIVVYLSKPVQCTCSVKCYYYIFAFPFFFRKLSQHFWPFTSSPTPCPNEKLSDIASFYQHRLLVYRCMNGN